MCTLLATYRLLRAGRCMQASTPVASNCLVASYHQAAAAGKPAARTQSLRHSCAGGRLPHVTASVRTASVQSGNRCMLCKGSKWGRRAGGGGG